jgi:carbamoyltransferase
MHRQIFAYHPQIGYLFVPNLKARVPTESGGYLIRSNAQGFRDARDFTKKPPPDKKRIFIFGDSFTAADGISNGERYSDLLEREMPDCEILNFGMPGTGTDQQYLIYREFGRSIHCDVIVVAVLVENIRRVAARYRHFTDTRNQLLCYAKPYFEMNGSELTLKNVPVPKDPVPDSRISAQEKAFVDQGGRFPSLRKLVIKAGLQDALQRAIHYQPLPEYDNPNHASWRLMSAVLKTWLSELKDKALIVPLPLYQHVEETASASAYQARFRELASEIGCGLFDPLPLLRQYPAKDRRAFRFHHDIHLTREGHQALARCLMPAMRNALGRRNG